MRPVILLDTGPLVSFLSRRDSHHRWAKEQINRLPHPPLTCEPVITEACFLTYRILGSSDPVLEFIQAGGAQITFDLNGEITEIRNLMTRYANVPISLADACLVRMSELSPGSLVLTNDSDFNIYRRHRNQIIPTLMPSA